VHVHDVTRALLASVGTAGTFNISAGVETNVVQILQALQDAAGTTLTPELAPLRSGELERSCLDPGHAAEQLGWRVEVNLQQGIEQTYRTLSEQFEADALSPDAR
jgi:UDP-glucose 4-epimerase